MGWSKAAVATGVLVVLAAAGLFIWRRTKAPAPGALGGGVKRIAVLPFENLGSPEDDYFADGIADEIRSKLTSLPGIEVIARAQLDDLQEDDEEASGNCRRAWAWAIC